MHLLIFVKLLIVSNYKEIPKTFIVKVVILHGIIRSKQGKAKKPSENLLVKQIFNFIRLSRTFEMKLIAIQKISCKNLKTKNNAQKKQKKYNEEKPGSFRGPKLWTRP